ncbi:MAG: DEAD/DEAH box helicase [Nitrososphaerota archaeon]
MSKLVSWLGSNMLPVWTNKINYEELSKIYHGIIVDLEMPRLTETPPPLSEENWYVVKKVEYILSKEDITSYIRNNSNLDPEETFRELLNRGFLVRIDKDPDGKNIIGYRSIHMDLLVRSTELRTKWDTPRYILTPLVSFEYLGIPSENDRRFLPLPISDNSIPRELYNSVRYYFSNDDKLTQDYINIMKEYFKGRGLDAFQAYTLSCMLKSNKRIHVIIAPTGSGKTEIFLFYMLAKLMKSMTLRKKSRILLLYPRIILSVDQSQRIIKLLDIANRYGYKFLFALRDGRTPKTEEIIEGTSNREIKFRGLRCVKFGCDGFLVYSREKDKPNITIRCSKCKAEFDFIRPVRGQLGDVDIIVTNMWTLQTRIMDSTEKDINVKTLLDVDVVIIDEAHEYTSLSGGLISMILDALNVLRSKHNEIEYVISSATIPSPEKFVPRLIRAPEHELTIYSYDKIPEAIKNEGLTGKRLIILAVLNMNPNYSWSTYFQLWAILTAFLGYAYQERNSIQALLFVDNLKELRRIHRGYEENISLREPKDHLSPELNSLNPYCYWHFLTANERRELYERLNKEPLRELEDLVAEIHSEVDESLRVKVIEALSSGKSLTVFTTSSLELGVDYPNVSFILNAGLSNPVSIRQRIGRGGRGSGTLRTVLGIILLRSIPTESMTMYDPNLRRKTRIATVVEESLPVASDNPQILKVGKLLKCISNLALNGEKTYASGESLRSIEDLKNFLRLIENCLRGD